ncbi:parallel beta-helix repeat (two copies) [Dyadobacter koreensis]|uniref:Parallel beta-helix repeat (Two copies) n=1 Tax=Dyadobacter koreensis TaxID=408657 RepID=A0A1H6VEG6_9BACT|nr:right-handed parallel beta-helix repeat-containing protein [Dyadobacter koreensis]SEJ02958.1 parallel beta-helix repeat (two copies) [Dyadobacter koreensis]
MPLYFRLFLTLLLLPPLLTCGQSAHVFYVSPSGSDRNIGTRAKPFATLTKAKQAARDLRKSKDFRKSITIFLREGNYKLSKTFLLSPEDSGSKNAPFSIAAYQGEKVVLSSALQLDAGNWKPISSSARKRLHPKVNAADVYELNVTPLRLAQARQFSAINSFMEGWPTIDLFANNQRQPISQWPNPTQIVHQKNDPGWATANGAKDTASFYFAGGGNPQDHDSTNEPDFDETSRSLRWRSALQSGHELWLKGFWRVPWSPVTSRVRSMDSVSIQLHDQPPGGMGSKYSAVAGTDPPWRVGSGRENWKLINTLEEIDMPGEWALDIRDQKIYYYPPKSLDELELSIAAQTGPVIHLENTQFVHLKGLWINGSLSSGIRLTNSRYINISGCNVYNVGRSGIKVSGGDHNLLQSNTIFQTGAAGIEMILQGNRQTLTSASSSLINNYIHHTGNLSFTEGILISNSVGVNVSHNLLHDLPKSAVRADSINNCIFEYNEIHNIALQESDNGAFYNYGGWSTYGNIFRYNFIHHINRSNGLYCDDGDSGDLFHNNIIHDAIEAIKFGGGHDNIARNNLIINSKSQNIDDRGINRGYSVGSVYEKGLLQMNPMQEPWKSYGKKLVAQFGLKHNLWADILQPEWHPEYPNGCRMQKNVTVNSGPFVSPQRGDVLIMGNVPIDSVNRAGFYNYQELDLRTKNPLILTKIQNLNQFFPKIGLYKDVYRRSLPDRKATGGLANRSQGGDLANEDQFVDKKTAPITN